VYSEDCIARIPRTGRACARAAADDAAARAAGVARVAGVAADR
jgi:hypothetical protein